MAVIAEKKADYVLLDYDGRYFRIPARFGEDVQHANHLAAYMRACEFACEERQQTENPATRPDWYERYPETRMEWLRLCSRLIPQALPVAPARPRC